MIHTPDSDLMPALQVEVAKAKKQLDAVYNDVETLKREKSITENDILRLEKHVAYLNDLATAKDSEIAKKEAAIKGLDSQIEDGQKKVDILHKEEATVSASLSKMEEEKSALIRERKEHESYIAESTESARKSRADADAKHLSADEKLSKIKTFIESI